MYFNGQILFDELIVIETEMERTIQAIKTLEKVSFFFKNLENNFDKFQIPGDLKIKELIDEIETNESFKKLLLIEEEIIKNKYVISDSKRFYLYARTGISSDKEDTNAGEISAGIKLRIPLGTKLDSKMKKELELAYFESQFSQKTRINNVLYSYKRYSELLDRAYNNYSDFLFQKEKLRISMMNLKYQNEPEELKNLFKRLIDFIDKENNLIDSKEALYLQAINIFSQNLPLNEKTYITDFNLNNLNKRIRPQHRTIYSWSSSFKAYSNTFIADSLAAKNITTIAISWDSGKNLEKIKGFIKIAETKNIKIQILLGNNKVLTAKNRLNFHKLIQDIFSVSDSLHLDIEPQAVKNTKLSENELWNNFKEIIKEISVLNKKKLIVSVPFHIPFHILKEIDSYTSEFFVMMYGKKNTDIILKRMEIFLSDFKNKTTIALRASDFKSQEEFENFISKLESATGIKKIAIHDLKQYYFLTGKN